MNPDDKTGRSETDFWSVMAAVIAHKLGNPLSAIEVYLDPLSKRIAEGREGEAQEILTKIRFSLERAKDYIYEFKALARSLEIQPKPVRLRPILEEICAMAQEKGILVEIDCSEYLVLNADPRRLGEVFEELLANSLHRFDKPEPRVVVQAFLPAGSPRVWIFFEDNGPGVSRDDKQRIFDAFYTTDPHGTGLGLALVRRIIEGHGGKIVEIGVEGRGARFRIDLPVAGPEALESVRT